MPYAPYITVAHQTRDDPASEGALHEVVIEKQDFAGAELTLGASLESYRWSSGRADLDVLDPLRPCTLRTEPLSESQGDLTAIQGIQSERVREYRLQAIRSVGTNGSRTESAFFTGFCLGDFIRTGLRGQDKQFVSITAKDRLQGLGVEWTAEGGTAFLGTRRLSKLFAELLGYTGSTDGASPLPLRVVMTWRPDQFTAADDPLSFFVDVATFYSTDRDGLLVAPTRGELLQELAGGLQLQVSQWQAPGDVLAWHLVQPGAFRDAAGGNVTEFRYDAEGTLQGSVSRPASTSYDAAGWVKGTDSAEGRQAYREARATYEHENPGKQFRNREFTRWSGPADNRTPDEWYIEIPSLTQEGVFDYGTLRMQSEEVTAADMEAGSTYRVVNFAEQSVPVVQQEVEGALFTARGLVRSEAINLGRYGSMYEFALFYSLYLETTSGTSYYYDVEQDAWIQTATESGPEQLIRAYFRAPGGPFAWQLVQHRLPPFPGSGQLRLRLFNGNGYAVRFDPPEPYALWTVWESVGLAFGGIESEGDAVDRHRTTYVEFDGFVEEGQVEEKTFRFGDGPSEGTAGALIYPTGGTTGSWTARASDADTYTLTRLWAREYMRLKRRGQPAVRFRLATGAAGGPAGPIPPPQTAFTFDGALYWPVSIDYAGGPQRTDVVGVRLDDFGSPEDSAEVTTSGEAGAGSGGAGGGAGGEDLYTQAPDLYVEQFELEEPSALVIRRSDRRAFSVQMPSFNPAYRILQGTATVGAGQMDTTVAPGVEVLLEERHVQITPTSIVPSAWRTVFPGDTTFRIELETAAAAAYNFAWRVVIEGDNVPPYWKGETVDDASAIEVDAGATPQPASFTYLALDENVHDPLTATAAVDTIDGVAVSGGQPVWFAFSTQGDGIVSYRRQVSLTFTVDAAAAYSDGVDTFTVMLTANDGLATGQMEVTVDVTGQPAPEPLTAPALIAPGTEDTQYFYSTDPGFDTITRANDAALDDPNGLLAGLVGYGLEMGIDYEGYPSAENESQYAHATQYAGGVLTLNWDALPPTMTGLNALTAKRGGRTFVWTSVDGATSYEVEVSTAADFSALVYQATVPAEGTAEEEHALPDTFDGEPYSADHYWRVRAKNSVETGPWSEERFSFLWFRAPSKMIGLDACLIGLSDTYGPQTRTSWQKMSGERSFGYEMQLGDGAGAVLWREPAGTSANIYTDLLMPAEAPAGYPDVPDPGYFRARGTSFEGPGAWPDEGWHSFKTGWDYAKGGLPQQGYEPLCAGIELIDDTFEPHTAGASIDGAVHQGTSSFTQGNAWSVYVWTEDSDAVTDAYVTTNNSGYHQLEPGRDFFEGVPGCHVIALIDTASEDGAFYTQYRGHEAGTAPAAGEGGMIALRAVDPSDFVAIRANLVSVPGEIILSIYHVQNKVASLVDTYQAAVPQFWPTRLTAKGANLHLGSTTSAPVASSLLPITGGTKAGVYFNDPGDNYSTESGIVQQFNVRSV